MDEPREEKLDKTEVNKGDLYALPIGSKVWFVEEKQGYSVRAKGAQYLILTKPFNPKKTVIYTILDIENMERGPENLVFGMGAETDEQCQEMLARLISNESEISSRRSIQAYVSKIRRITTAST